MTTPAGIDALLADTQTAYADALDLAELCTHAATGQPVDRDRLAALRRRLDNHQPQATNATVALLAGLLGTATAHLAAHGHSADRLLADWRRLAALAINTTEHDLTGGAP